MVTSNCRAVDHQKETYPTEDVIARSTIANMTHLVQLSNKPPMKYAKDLRHKAVQ